MKPIETYRAFQKQWARSNVRASRGGRILLDRNTWLYRISNGLKPESYAVRLHVTDIATFHADGSVDINTGGWETRTTLDRLRYACELPVMNTLGVWHIDGFEIGRRIVLHPDGTATSPRGERVRSAAEAITEKQEVKRKEKNRRARARRAELKANKERMEERERARKAEERARWQALSPAERLAERLAGEPIPEGCSIDEPHNPLAYRQAVQGGIALYTTGGAQ
jgi:hypothetical protein